MAALRKERAMSETIAVEGQPLEPGLTPVQRVVDSFVAPSKTFADILRNSSWWLPYLLSALIGLVFAYAILY
jgi:hypothetical protein